MKTFNFYCDESTHLENDKEPYMLLSYVCSPYNKVKEHSSNIIEMKKKHRFKGEIKWTSISNKMLPFYEELIDYFFASDLNFRAVIVDKKQIDNNRFDFSYNDFYFRMYYQLVFQKINQDNSYNIYVDIKDTCSHRKLKRLDDILAAQSCQVNNLQFIHSYESALMQLTDVIMGAINYHLRGYNTMQAKNHIIQKISNYSNISLDRTTPKYKDKFNLFFIELK